MKWLLFTLILTGLIIWWRYAQIEQNGRSSTKTTKQAKVSKPSDVKEKKSSPQEMNQCPSCGLRFPTDEGVGSYCSLEHRNAIDPKGWWGNADWLKSPNYDERPTGVPIELVLIHHISLPPGQFGNNYIAYFFQNKLDPNAHPYFQEIADHQVSSHFLIKRDGQVQQFVSTLHRAWHAGVSEFFGRESCNDFSIGIELEGDGERPFEDVQYVALANLSAQLELVYSHLLFAGHSDIAPGRKNDPGTQFDWQKFQSKNNIPVEKLPFGLQPR
jgi:AmpD protein